MPWTTVNTGYLDKFYDIYAERQGLPEEYAEKSFVADADIRFGKYGEMVHLDFMPLWNIESVTFDSMDFMVPCIDGIYYEHEFHLEGGEGGGRLSDTVPGRNIGNPP